MNQTQMNNLKAKIEQVNAANATIRSQAVIEDQKIEALINYVLTLPVDATPPPPPPPPPPATGWPTSANTGPRVPLTVHNGDFFTSSANQLIEKMEIRGRIYKRHSNITIRDSRILGDSDAGGGVGWFGVQNENGGPFTIEYSEIGKSGTGSLSVGIQLGSGTIRNSELHHVSDGIQASGGATIENNFIHDLYAYNDQAHCDGIQMFGGGGQTTIRGNYIDCDDHSQYNLLPNGSIFFQGNFDPVLVDKNFMLGGGYLLRLESGVRNATVKDNRFRVTDNRGWGTHLIQGSVISWSGNVNDLTNQPVNQ